MTLLTIASAAAVVGLMVLGTFLLSVVRGAGSEFGKAGLAESAPWIAKFSSRLALRVFLFRRPGQFEELEPELLTLVDETFSGGDGVTDRARGIFVVWRELWGLATAASDLRDTPLSQSSPDAKPELQKLSETDWSAFALPRMPVIPPIPTLPASSIRAMTDFANAYTLSAKDIAKVLGGLDTSQLEKSFGFMNSAGMLAAVESAERAADIMNSPGMLASVKSLEKYFRGWR